MNGGKRMNKKEKLPRVVFALRRTTLRKKKENEKRGRKEISLQNEKPKKDSATSTLLLLRLVPQQLAPLAVLVLVHLVLALAADGVGAERDERRGGRREGRREGCFDPFEGQRQQPP